LIGRAEDVLAWPGLASTCLWGWTRGAFGAPLLPGQIFFQLFVTPQARSMQNLGLAGGGVAEL
jgi:hypothetical protein